jgi:DNA repair protein RecN (Recombination protein N)
MLLDISIRQIVLIDRLEMAFGPGLCVLTGETGAGKSILLDSLALALGARADAGLLATGAKEGSVVAEFAPPAGHPAHAMLAEHGIGAEERLVLRRVLTADGRGRAFVNDQPVGVNLLKRLGDSLVEIQGQGAEQGLLAPANHRALLDAFAGLGPQLAATRTAHARLAMARTALEEAEAAATKARAEEEFLRHAAKELAELDPQPEEEQKLAELRGLMMQSEKIVGALSEATEALEQQGGVDSRLRTARRALERAAPRAQGRLDGALQALEAAAIAVNEAALLVETTARALEHDPAKLEDTETRLFALKAAARKHQTTVEALPALAAAMQDRLAGLERQDAAVRAAAAERMAAEAEFVAAAEALSKGRRAAAQALDKAVARELAPLKLEKAKFVTTIESQAREAWGAEGAERVVFEVSTNPGQAPGALHRIASGGELARFMLALQAALSRKGPAPTLVFDEVDRGVGGATAAAVGARLAKLAKGAQVLVITHSPQVAAQGSQHWRIAKSGGRTTVTRVEQLDDAGRREEIARMLAGSTVTPEARAAAERLMQGAS